MRQIVWQAFCQRVADGIRTTVLLGIAMIAAAGAGIVIWTAVKVGAHSERRHRERKGEISRRRPEPLA